MMVTDKNLVLGGEGCPYNDLSTTYPLSLAYDFNKGLPSERVVTNCTS